MRLIRIDHVQLAIPPGREADARGFYGQLLGLPETKKPPELAARGGLWFETGELKLHLGTEATFRPSAKAHAAFVVEGLSALVERLTGAGFAVRENELFDAYRRIHVLDPFGNRLEFMERTV